MWSGCLGLQHPHAPQKPHGDTLCVSYDTQSPEDCQPRFLWLPHSRAAILLAPCVPLWYLHTHKAIHKLVQAGLATTEVSQVNIL